jgi:hypothetical protein
MANYRFGKHPPKHDYRTLRFKNYLTPEVADAPASLNVLDRVYKSLNASDPTKLFPMDGNDQYGDCTIAALAHAITVYRGLLGKEKIITAKAVQKLYFHLSGGQDTGLNELDVLNYWKKTKVSGDEILAYASVDPKNHQHVKQAIQLFGGVYLGFQVQENCIQDFNARKPWTSGKLTNDGHAVYAVAYDPKHVTVLTWGNTQLASWDWWNECVDEAYAIVPPEAKDPKFAPGYNVKQLLADLSDISMSAGLA